ncbi:hypothetical protein [uncultured Mediterranean phage]|nr:hypothetical protein [uncultured Mediterranean phage]
MRGEIVYRSKYEGVVLMRDKNMRAKWMMRYSRNGLSCMKEYPSEREAAIHYDLKMIERGEKPVNIYKQQLCEK